MKTRARVASMMIVAMAVLGLGLYRVNRRHQLIRIGYELSSARGDLRKLQEEQNRLRLEESVLTSPARIEQIAGSLGMIRPTPDQLRIIPSKASVAQAPVEAPQQD